MSITDMRKIAGLELAAKAAYTEMIRRCLPSGDSLQDHAWELQSWTVREDWMAAVYAAVAEEREACAKLADDVEATYETREDDPIHGPRTVCQHHEFAPLIRARGKDGPVQGDD